MSGRKRRGRIVQHRGCARTLALAGVARAPAGRGRQGPAFCRCRKSPSSRLGRGGTALSRLGGAARGLWLDSRLRIGRPVRDPRCRSLRHAAHARSHDGDRPARRSRSRSQRSPLELVRENSASTARASGLPFAAGRSGYSATTRPAATKSCRRSRGRHRHAGARRRALRLGRRRRSSRAPHWLVGHGRDDARCALAGARRALSAAPPLSPRLSVFALPTSSLDRSEYAAAFRRAGAHSPRRLLSGEPHAAVPRARRGRRVARLPALARDQSRAVFGLSRPFPTARCCAHRPNVFCA